MSQQTEAPNLPLILIVESLSRLAPTTYRQVRCLLTLASIPEENRNTSISWRQMKSSLCQVYFKYIISNRWHHKLPSKMVYIKRKPHRDLYHETKSSVTLHHIFIKVWCAKFSLYVDSSRMLVCMRSLKKQASKQPIGLLQMKRVLPETENILKFTIDQKNILDLRFDMQKLNVCAIRILVIRKISMISVSDVSGLIWPEL